MCRKSALLSLHSLLRMRSRYIFIVPLTCGTHCHVTNLGLEAQQNSGGEGVLKQPVESIHIYIRQVKIAEGVQTFVLEGVCSLISDCFKEETSPVGELLIGRMAHALVQLLVRITERVGPLCCAAFTHDPVQHLFSLFPPLVKHQKLMVGLH